ncbi:uncharacterized protein DUF3826 [Dysgonomonas alginatilytica]|uniref:Uncharacterized protein DUF3826 n=1 Tax=Dysgonomonas alginatilytica TaxID=1605892 RepID=A0A2V3PS41_9BACT|nr:DUF3826 domain-containing protein [Dysgonomonas alginatilytica]PXV64750.1 uncharacterized protein DUF3826 [Dysgonomonas alginatilytica]
MKSLILFVSVLISLSAFSQNKEEEYNKVLTQRAKKIVNTLDLNDKSVYDAVTQVIVTQYKGLGELHDKSDADIKNAKQNIADKTAKENAIKALDTELNSNLYNLHCAYIGALSAYLTNDQVEKVKDGMTYGVVQVTYTSYQDMIPSLKPEEKRQLYAWLVEAREHAMSAASSKEKHEWFGKYKGRFNNYLSKQGYDIQKEREEWQKRIKEKETTKK